MPPPPARKSWGSARPGHAAQLAVGETVILLHPL